VDRNESGTRQPSAQAKRMIQRLYSVAPLDLTDETEVQNLDAEDGEVPQKSGTVFRAKQVFRCPACNALTNHMEVRGGFKGWRATPFPICPHREESWHKNLRGKIRLAREPHPKTYLEELQQEIAELRLNAKDDVVGDVDLDSEKTFPALKLGLTDGGYE
jgi:hypothetical protein